MIFKPNDTFKKTFKVSETVFEGFINVFHDKNPLHTDEAFARSKGFRQKVMHGNILNGFLSYFIGECLPLKEVVIHSQEIQYKLPVYINDELLFESTITDVHESVSVVEFSFRFLNNESKIVSKGKFQIGLLL